jgi:cytochrome c553
MVGSRIALIGLVACATSVADPPKQTPEHRFERAMMSRFHMHQNFDLVRAIERLLIRGKLEEAKRFAAAIASAPEEPGLDAWRTYTIQVRERAGAVARAKDVDDAVRKVALLGGACGNCHGATAVSTEFDNIPKLPLDKQTIEARMLRHRWATDRLWEGLVGNSEIAWGQGLDVLAATPLDEPADRAKLARQLQRIAAEARRPSAGPLVDRAIVYGEILSTCASCHR